MVKIIALYKTENITLLLVKANLAYSAIPFSLSGNKLESLYIHFYAKDHRKKIRQAKYADGKP